MLSIDTPVLAGGARKSNVSRICKKLNEMVQQFGARSLQACYPYISLDAIVLKVRENHRSIHSVNPLEHLNREIQHRTRVVGVFPDSASVYRLVGTLLVNTDEDWRVGRNYLGKEGIEKIFVRFPEKREKEFILEEALINLEAQNAIYTT